MPCHGFVQRRAESPQLQSPIQMPRFGKIVSRCSRAHLLNKPYPLLVVQKRENPLYTNSFLNWRRLSAPFERELRLTTAHNVTTSWLIDWTGRRLPVQTRHRPSEIIACCLQVHAAGLTNAVVLATDSTFSQAKHACGS